MGLLIATIVVGAIILIAGIIAGIIIACDGGGGKGFLITLATPLAAILLLFGCFRSVGANQVGIIYDDRSGVVERTYEEGFGTKSIFEHITTLSTANRTSTATTTGQTNDGQYATFDLSLIYKIKKDNAGKFYKVTNATDMPAQDLESLVKKCLQSSTINFNIFDLLSEGLETARIDFYEDLKKNLNPIEYLDEKIMAIDSKLKDPDLLSAGEKQSLETQRSNYVAERAMYLEKEEKGAPVGYYVTLISASFDDVDAGKDIEDILKAKAEADQKIQIAMKEAEAAMITAQNQAEIEKLLADAEAYATRVRGEANGEAESAYVDKILMMIDTLFSNIYGTVYTPEVIANLTVGSDEWKAYQAAYKTCADAVLSIIFYNTWDGKLPEVMTGDALEGLIGGLLAQNGGSGDSGTNP